MKELYHNFIKHPHDTFFKIVFKNSNNAKDFINIILPDNIKKYININNLKVVNSSYITKEFKNRFADLVFETNLINSKHNINIYFLFEHKSYKDNAIFIQLLRYMLVKWEKDFQNNKELSLIIPVVFYHGKSKWDIDTEFINNFKIDKEIKNNFKKYLLNFKYLFFNDKKNKLSYKVMNYNRYLKLALDVLKYKAEEDMKLISRILEELAKEIENRDIKNVFYVYILSILKSEDREMVIKKLEEKESKMPSILESLIKEGEIKGKTEGLKEGTLKGQILDKQQVLIKQIELKFGITNDEKQVILNCFDRDKLERGIEKILFVNNKIEIITIFKK